MQFFDNIVKYFTSPRSGDEGAYWVYVRCNQCGETLRARVNLYNDLSVDYQGRKGQTYHNHKTLVGRQGCFQRIEIELSFDRNRKMLEREISGGTFIEADEYSARDR
ncbi:MAG: hypothetical protein V3U36_01840 [Anaerolineales bacterium]